MTIKYMINLAKKSNFKFTINLLRETSKKRKERNQKNVLGLIDLPFVGLLIYIFFLL
jgi:hypothetical protein